MQQYETMTEALSDLEKRGFGYNYNLKADCIECSALDLRLHPEDFEILELYRFEGMNDPDDSAVVYAIRSKDGIQGTLVNAYGVYSDPLSDSMIRKLAIRS